MTNQIQNEPGEPTKVLEMRDVTLRTSGRRNRLRNIDLVIVPGQLHAVLRSADQQKVLLANGALGLLKPRRGRVLFESQDWQAVRFGQQLLMRRKIGRVFDQNGWIQNLTVLDNILLGTRHHTQDAESAIKNRMDEISDELGIKIVNQRPAFVETWRLRIYQWVRALMLRPDFLIAERPLMGLPSQYHDSVIQSAQKFRNDGGAVLWITDSEQTAERICGKDDKSASRYVIRDEKLTRFEETVS